MSEEKLDYGEMKNNLLVYKSKEQVADICIAHYKEIERLNNILNELEQWLEFEYKHILNNKNYKFVLNKIQKLKGEDKE